MCVALTNQDEERCNRIDTFENRNFCLALINQNVSFCRKMSDEDSRKNCFYEIVLLTKNISLCNELSNRVHCYFSFVNHLFWRGNHELIKEEYCEMFPEGDPDKNDCWAYMSNNVSLCGDDPTCLTCFEQPLSFCENITFKEKNDCIRDRALSSHNSSICEMINNTYMRDDCYMDYSNHASPNASLCEKIRTPSLKDMCYLELTIRNYTKS